MQIKAFLIGFGVLAAIGQAASAEDRLTPLLRFVPPEAVSGGLDHPVLFSDLSAIRQAANSRMSLTDAFSLTPHERELAALTRATFTALPGMLSEYTQYNVGSFDAMPDYLGFRFTDIELSLGFGNHPDAVMVLAGAPALADAGGPGATLTGRGFSAEERGGHPFWWHLADNEIDMSGRDAADPLRGVTGGSARAGIVSGAFVAAANWTAIDSLIAAVDRDPAGLSGSDDFLALAYALNQPQAGDGALLQAYLMQGAFSAADALSAVSPNLSADEQSASLERMIDRGEIGRLPRYRAIGFGDRQEGQQTVGVIALVYESRDHAELAAEMLPAAIRTMDSIVSRRPIYEVLDFEVSSRVAAPTDANRYVATIALSTALPRPDGPMQQTRTPFSTLLQMIMMRDIALFVAEDS